MLCKGAAVQILVLPLWYHSLCKNMLMSRCYYSPDSVSNQLLYSHSWKTLSIALLLWRLHTLVNVLLALYVNYFYCHRSEQVGSPIFVINLLYRTIVITIDAEHVKVSIIAERLSVRQLILLRIPFCVRLSVCMSVTLI